MRYYGAEYGLNYGVSLPTLRSLAQSEMIDEQKDHPYAKYLFMQQVREIRLIALHIAAAEQISADELDFWAEGVLNSEVAEEAAFALFQHVDSSLIMRWLNCENELLIYCAMLSLSRSKKIEVNNLKPLITKYLSLNSILINSAMITLLESYFGTSQFRSEVSEIIAELPATKSADYIREELQWRCEMQAAE